MINGLIVIVKELPKPIQYSSILYLSCLFGYNIYGAYGDSKLYLDKFRARRLKDLRIPQYDIDKINTDWDAVTYGANDHFCERLWNSIIWPITTVTNIIPTLVLFLHPLDN